MKKNKHIKNSKYGWERTIGKAKPKTEIEKVLQAASSPHRNRKRAPVSLASVPFKDSQ